jgi:hypothetical protein
VPVIVLRVGPKATETDLGGAPAGSVKVTPNETVAPATATAGETEGSVSLPSE